MEISYKLEKFEGPLDLLLKLIEKNKVSIFDIPIETITEQYLSYVQGMEFQDLDLLSDFLVMAATLLDIKSRMLLPAEETEEEEEGDPKAELVQRLLEYKMYKYISRELEQYEERAGRVFYRAPQVPKEVAAYEPPVNLDEVLEGLTREQLRAIFNAVMRRSAMRVDPVRSGFGTIRREVVSLEETVADVMNFARTKRRFSFRQVIRKHHDRVHVVVAFLAVLELMKIGKIRLTQDALFDDMNIETIEPEGETGELDLEGLDDFDGE
ncbi:MAG: segregation/condensation protein A [Clostridium sp.]|nr:segregation/condensation protein A [Clostridium sp.]